MRLPPILLGALAGVIATVPMTLVLFGMARVLPSVKKFPSGWVVKQLTKKAGIWPTLSMRERSQLSWTGHVGYGMLMGSIYLPLAKERSGIGRGMAFGVSVWAGSYLGMLPLVASRKPFKKSFLDDHLQLVIAHLVWGSYASRNKQSTPPASLTSC